MIIYRDAEIISASYYQNLGWNFFKMQNQWKKCSDPSITISPEVMKMNKAGTHLSLLGKEDTSPYGSIKICLCYALVLPFSSQNPKGRQRAFSCCTSFLNSLAIKVFQNCIIRMFWESHFFWNSVHFSVVIKKKNLPTVLFSMHACTLSHFFSCVQLLWTLMDYSPLGSPVHGVLQARILEWVAIPSSRGSSRSRG